MVLYRLLENLPAANYCLISRENYGKLGHHYNATKMPCARYYKLDPTFRVPRLYPFRLTRLRTVFNTGWEIYRRARQIKRILNEERCDVVIGCSGDLCDPPAAYLASRWAGIRFVAYFFDDYAYQWTGFGRTIAKLIEPTVLKSANGVIVPNEFLQVEYLKRYDISSVVIHNPCQLPELIKLDNWKRAFDDKNINIVYTGSIYHAQHDAFRNLIRAIQLLERTNVILHLYTAQTESELLRYGISGPMIRYHQHIPESEVPAVLRQATILFLPLAFNSPIPEVIRTSAPGKTGEYLSVGRPILVHVPNKSFVSWYFIKHRCGVVVEKNDSHALAAALDRMISDRGLYEDLGIRARKRAEKDFDIAMIRTKFYSFISTVSQAY